MYKGVSCLPGEEAYMAGSEWLNKRPYGPHEANRLLKLGLSIICRGPVQVLSLLESGPRPMMLSCRLDTRSLTVSRRAAGSR